MDSCCTAKIGGIEYTDTGMLLAIQTPEQLQYSKSCYPEDSNTLGNDEPRILSVDRAQEIEPLLSSDLLGCIRVPTVVNFHVKHLILNS